MTRLQGGKAIASGEKTTKAAKPHREPTATGEIAVQTLGSRPSQWTRAALRLKKTAWESRPWKKRGEHG
jgi:hypothetical protein